MSEFIRLGIASAFSVVGFLLLFFAGTGLHLAIRMGPAPLGSGKKDATWRATGLVMSGAAAIGGAVVAMVGVYIFSGGLS